MGTVLIDILSLVIYLIIGKKRCVKYFEECETQIEYFFYLFLSLTHTYIIYIIVCSVNYVNGFVEPIFVPSFTCTLSVIAEPFDTRCGWQMPTFIYHLFECRMSTLLSWNYFVCTRNSLVSVYVAVSCPLCVFLGKNGLLCKWYSQFAIHFIEKSEAEVLIDR